MDGIFDNYDESNEDITEEIGSDFTDPEFDEPQEDDYKVFDHRGKTVITQYGKFLGEFNSEDEAYEWIAEDMKKSGCYPSVFFISDHGNAHLVSDFYQQYVNK